MSKFYMPARLFLICLILGLSVFQMSMVSFAQTDSDGDGRPDAVDECPNTPGTVRGCPDDDGDGFHNREDECPNVVGTVRGCPDSDGDGRPDVIDECPNTPGTARGCPDGDGDGFHDREDECPNVAGTIRGCPDSDGDGRPDVIDDCPNTPGSLNGCPDSDGDGFHDREDECPNVAGTIRGCPDSDGDGRPDVVDDCPTIAGTIRGCPPTNTPQPTTSTNQTVQPTSTPAPTPTDTTIPVFTSPCEITPAVNLDVTIHQRPSPEADMLGVLEQQAYLVYGITAPNVWYWIEGGWVDDDHVILTGDCGALVTFDVSSDTAIMPFADVNLATAQISCSFIIELSAPFCFYQLPAPDDETIPMTCIVQNGVLNCEKGFGVLWVLFSQVFDVANLQTPPDDNTEQPLACVRLWGEFLAPYFENNPLVSFRVMGDYLVLFASQPNFAPVQNRSCRQTTNFVLPMVENNEITSNFLVQPIMTQYDTWSSNHLIGDDVPLMAILLPDSQKARAKKGSLAGEPIMIDFINQTILFGDSTLFFGFNSVSFIEQVELLIGQNFIASPE